MDEHVVAAFDFGVEQQMVHHLMLQSPFEEDLGLFYGKMGIAIFFFHYGRYLKNNVYVEIGNELLDSIWNNINSKMTISFNSGLSGIGWGIEYLIQNQFIQGNSNDVCEDIDKTIMQLNLLKLADKTLDTGLDGILYYVSARIKGSILQNNSLPYDSDYLNDLLLIQPSFEANNFSMLFSQYPLDASCFVNDMAVCGSSIDSMSLGLKSGLAGILYNKIQNSEKSLYNK